MHITFTDFVYFKIIILMSSSRSSSSSRKKEIPWNKETAKALGIFFHSQIKQILELNYQLSLYRAQ